MISRYEATLNGLPLSGIAEEILILDISYSPPEFKNETYTVAKRQGSRIYRRHTDSLEVAVSFTIRAYNTLTRQRICNAVQQWAKNGGELRINDREGQRLRCICETLPAITSALKWADPLTVVFAAYALPFWEETIPSTLSLSGTSGSGNLWVPGIDKAMVGVEATANAAVSSLALTVGSRTLVLSGLSVASGQVIKISYDDDMIQSIKAGSTSLLNKRTGADDLIAECGENNTCSFTASASMDVVFKARGLWA